MDERTKVQTELQKAMDKAVTVDVDFGFTKSSLFNGYHPTKRVELVKAANTQLLWTVLTGNAAFTGPEGLCEFKEVVEVLKSKISVVKFAIDAGSLRHLAAN